MTRGARVGRRKVNMKRPGTDWNAVPIFVGIWAPISHWQRLVSATVSSGNVAAHSIVLCDE